MHNIKITQRQDFYQTELFEMVLKVFKIINLFHQSKFKILPFTLLWREKQEDEATKLKNHQH